MGNVFRSKIWFYNYCFGFATRAKVPLKVSKFQVYNSRINL